jgi:3-oxoacyl-[acyl-carrier-protein] synthase-3
MNGREQQSITPDSFYGNCEHGKFIGIVDVTSSVGMEAVLSSELEIQQGLAPGYIYRRTGIRNRYYKSPESSFLDLALESVKKLILNTGISPSDISALICASTTFDRNSPSLACQVMNYIDPDATNNDCFAVDMNAACSGYVYALSIAKSKLAELDIRDKKKFAIVITNEVYSDYLGYFPSSDILFGDASTATLIEISDVINDNWKAVLHKFHTGSIRDKNNSICIYSENGIGKMSMKGSFVFENAIKTISHSTEKILKLCALQLDDVDLFVTHQANAKIIDSISRKINVDKSKFYINIEQYGNTGASSAPLCLAEIFANGKKSDDRIKTVLTTFGSGFTFGTVFAELFVSL